MLDPTATNDRLLPKRALLSVSDKSGITDFAQALERIGCEILSTGGTARTLREAGVSVRDVSEVTGFPEMLDGRVKTLHPMVHGGILARRDIPAHIDALANHGIGTIDLVCVNLYPFEQTIASGAPDEEAIEQIDIGGPAMVRSAAKNFRDVAIITDANQLEQVMSEIESGGILQATRRCLAGDAFARTASYDASIAAYFARTSDADLNGLPARCVRATRELRSLRYGENPHQGAALHIDLAHDPAAPSLASAEPLGGKALSYNNLNDANHAGWLAHDLARATNLHAAAVIKHTNPCGAAVSKDPAHVVELAIDGDPQAAYGGILAMSSPVDGAIADRIIERAGFLEVILAPSFTPDAIDSLHTRWKNVRLLPFDLRSATWSGVQSTAIPGGALVQQVDADELELSAWTDGQDARCEATVTDVLAWICVKHVTSNAVVLANAHDHGALLVGVGSGQVDRVTACRLAVSKAADRAAGSVAASDAFFPFTDGPGVLADAGITRVLQPGGSKRDGEVLSYCAERGMTTVLTHRRHFRH